MAISTSLFTLVSKKSLTHDVWELDFLARPVITPQSTSNISIAVTPQLSNIGISESFYELSVTPGQYILFVFSSGLRRAYSIAYSFIRKDSSGNIEQLFRFVIKRLPHEGAGSAEICDLPIGEFVKGMGPLGHFVLGQELQDTLFIGTGTGFAPLYYQIRSRIEQGSLSKMHFVFGVRSEEDTFYHQEIANLGNGLGFTQYYSNPKNESSGTKGYVTAYLTHENIVKYEQFSICGSPAMVKSAREILDVAGVVKENIKFEQY